MLSKVGHGSTSRIWNTVNDQKNLDMITATELWLHFAFEKYEV